MLEVRNRGGKGALSASFRHHSETYYMDLCLREHDGTCVLTFWRKVPSGRMYLKQEERNDIGVSIRWAVKCAQEYCQGLEWRMRK